MFKTRLISGILLVAVALLTIMSGSYILFFTLLGISLIGMQELYKAMQVHKEKFTLLEITGYVGAVVYYIAMAADYEKYGMMGLILALILLLFVYVFTYPRFHAGEVMVAFFGIVYVAVMLSFIYLTRNLADGKYIVWLIFLCSWGCDTCAYCTGMLIGKHKMAPVLSPKKSVEGAVGGVAGAALLGALSMQQPLGGTQWQRICLDLRSWSADLHGRRSGCFCHQEKSENQGLRQTDPGTRRNP